LVKIFLHNKNWVENCKLLFIRHGRVRIFHPPKPRRQDDLENKIELIFFRIKITENFPTLVPIRRKNNLLALRL
jgi:hypothetical protein